MNIDKIIAALNSNLRREILKILAEQPMTVIKVLEKLRDNNFNIKYRETVYRNLEKLFEAGLVEKNYVKEKGICYTIAVNSVVIDITKCSIEIY